MKHSEGNQLSNFVFLIHCLLVVFGWALYVYLFFKIILHYSIIMKLMAVLLLICILVQLPLTIYWVLHNQSIYKKKGPRLKSKMVPYEYDKDWNGYNTVADWGKMQKTSRIIVAIDKKTKTKEFLDG